MTFYTTGQDVEDYYQNVIKLQEELRKNEEERLQLEVKLNAMVHVTQEEEQLYFKQLKSQYRRFMESSRMRQERNAKILQLLEQVEHRAATFEAKTKRFKMLRNQYHAFLLNSVQDKKNKEKEAKLNVPGVPLNQIIDPKPVSAPSAHDLDMLNELLHRIKVETNKVEIDNAVRSIYERNIEKLRNSNVQHVTVEDDTDDSTTSVVEAAIKLSHAPTFDPSGVTNEVKQEQKTTLNGENETRSIINEVKIIPNVQEKTDQLEERTESENFDINTCINNGGDEEDFGTVAVEKIQENIQSLNDFERDANVVDDNGQELNEPITIDEGVIEYHEQQQQDHQGHQQDLQGQQEFQQLQDDQGQEYQQNLQGQHQEFQQQLQDQQEQGQMQQEQQPEQELQQQEEPQQEHSQELLQENNDYLSTYENNSQIYYDENGQPMHFDENSQEYRYNEPQYDESYYQNNIPNEQVTDYMQQEYDQNGDYNNGYYDENGQPLTYNPTNEQIENIPQADEIFPIEENVANGGSAGQNANVLELLDTESESSPHAGVNDENKEVIENESDFDLSAKSEAVEAPTQGN